MVFSSLLEQGFGEGGAPLKHAAGCLNRIIGDRLDDHLPGVGQGHENLAAGSEADPLSKLGRDDDLPFGRGFNDSHFCAPLS